VPEILKTNGISSHMVTDHYHYFEDGGATYHPRYSTWQTFRGQEGDPWMGQASPPTIPDHINGKVKAQDWVNRQFIQQDADFPQNQTFAAGLDFIERNHQSDAWFLQIETFDPHEPFTAPESAQKDYAQAGESPIFDWPGYQNVSESEEEIQRVRDNYSALISLCDTNLGKVLDAMDRHNMWKDTMLIVGTDHGYLLGEHGRWAKNIPTIWNEIARTPFFVWDPRSGASGERRDSLVQPAIDLAPTLLRFFGLQPTADMTGQDLQPVIEADQSVRTSAVFGHFGEPVHITDGQYVYMRFPENPETPRVEYTWMPCRMAKRFEKQEFTNCSLGAPLPFSKGIPVPQLRTERPTPLPPDHRLFDIRSDPRQENPLDDSEVEERLLKELARQMQAVHAPACSFNYFGIPNPSSDA
jgi:arylsulfatase A-like enzyme